MIDKDLLYIEEFIIPLIVAKNLSSDCEWKMNTIDGIGTKTLYIEKRDYRYARDLAVEIFVGFYTGSKIVITIDHHHRFQYKNIDAKNLEDCKKILKEYIENEK